MSDLALFLPYVSMPINHTEQQTLVAFVRPGMGRVDVGQEVKREEKRLNAWFSLVFFNGFGLMQSEKETKRGKGR